MTKSDIPPAGTKVELTLRDIFGKPYAIVGKISKDPYQHGYHCKSGAWCLYQSIGDLPCFKIEFVPKGKRNCRVLQIADIISILEVKP
jgi:hypothetical protein